MNVAMIPARIGSHRLRQKNLREIDGVPLVARAIRKCKEVEAFDQIWVNADDARFAEIADAEGASFHPRPAALADNAATSEDFVYEFLKAHPCEYIFQVHTIAPLLTADQIGAFVEAMIEGGYDAQLSVVNEQIECMIDGEPINFAFDQKTNSQELTPVQRITWSITGWRAATFLTAHEAGECGTYAGQVGFFAIDWAAGHIIKTEEDLRVAQALYSASVTH